MVQVVSNRPRVAWDSARVIVAAVDAGFQGWLGYVLGERIDASYHGYLLDSWSRMNARPETKMAEAGLWRARLDDLLVERPEVAAELAAIMQETTTLLSGWGRPWA